MYVLYLAAAITFIAFIYGVWLRFSYAKGDKRIKEIARNLMLFTLAIEINLVVYWVMLMTEIAIRSGHLP